MLLIPSTLTLTEDLEKGRRLLAAASFKPGELIATFEDPLVAIPSSADLGVTTCSYCLSRPAPGWEEAKDVGDKKKVRACTACQTAAYCSKRCQRADWNRTHKKGECKAYQRARARSTASRDGGGEPSRLPTPVRALIQLLLLTEGEGEANETEREGARELQSHVMSFRGSGSPGSPRESWHDMSLQALAALHYLGREADSDTVADAVELLCKVSSGVCECII